jgi:hypothetical protein
MGEKYTPYKCVSTDYKLGQLNSVYTLNYVPQKLVLVLFSHVQLSQKRSLSLRFWHDAIFLIILFPPMHATRPSHYNLFDLSILILGKPIKFPTLVATRSKTLVCGRSLAGIVGSNSAGEIDVYLLWVVCCQVEVSGPGWSLVQGRVLPSVMCHWV